jgi:nitroreductase
MIKGVSNMLELLRSRRSIRKYEDKPLSKEQVDTLLKAALLAPSSKARRPWEFIAVTDKEILAKLAKSRQQGSSRFLDGAALAVVVIADKDKSEIWIEDASIAATVLHLTAHSMDLGSCWVQIRERMYDEVKTSEDYVKDVLNIPDNYSVECIISIGYPAEEKKGYEDKDLKFEKIHFDTYK